MSGQGDGAIIVDTDVDASGLEKGMNNLRRSMESLTVAIERIGKKMESSVSAYAKALSGSVQDIQQLQDGVEQTGTSTKSALSDMADKTKEISAAADKTAESYGKVAHEAEKAKAALSEVGEAANSASQIETTAGMIDKFKKELSELESYKDAASELYGFPAHMIQNFSGLLDSAAQNLAKIQESVQGLSGTEEFERLSAEAQTLEERLIALGEILDDVKESKKALENSPDSGEVSQMAEGLQETVDAAADVGEQSGKISELTQSIEAAKTALSRFQARTAKMDAVGASDKAWASIKYDIGLAADEAERLKEELDALSKNGGIDETQYENLSQRLQDAMEGFNALTGAADETETETRRIPPVVRGIGTAFSIPLRAFGALASHAGRLGIALANITGAGFLSFMRTFAASAGEAAFICQTPL